MQRYYTDLEQAGIYVFLQIVNIMWGLRGFTYQPHSPHSCSVKSQQIAKKAENQTLFFLVFPLQIVTTGRWEKLGKT